MPPHDEQAAQSTATFASHLRSQTPLYQRSPSFSHSALTYTSSMTNLRRPASVGALRSRSQHGLYPKPLEGPMVAVNGPMAAIKNGPMAPMRRYHANSFRPKIGVAELFQLAPSVPTSIEHASTAVPSFATTRTMSYWVCAAWPATYAKSQAITCLFHVTQASNIQTAQTARAHTHALSYAASDRSMLTD